MVQFSLFKVRGFGRQGIGAKQFAFAVCDCGVESVQEGIRLAPTCIVYAVLEEGLHLVGRFNPRRLGEIPVVVGGIVPPEDAKELVGIAAAGYERAA